ncbi:MAG: tRNA (adenosine(37)-N6)-threonylcarbamoyltransferase complex ATPase subunit type 1 TsaE, partial [Actinomycetota bacterium]
MRIELRAETPEDTRAVGEAVASLLRPGDAVALTGELGAGKTTFVRGTARALGFEGNVASPTFTLVREYQGRLPIYHVDVYRLERVQDVLDLGLDEMLGDGGV